MDENHSLWFPLAVIQKDILGAGLQSSAAVTSLQDFHITGSGTNFRICCFRW